MSGSKSGKRISVFDRLGPADEPSPAHRRYSSDKHSEKGRHTHGHTRTEERKPSQPDFDGKKHLPHYREPAPHSSRDPAPHSSRTSVPHSSRDPAPHSSRDPAPHSSRDAAPHTSRDPAPHASRNPAPHSSQLRHRPHYRGSESDPSEEEGTGTKKGTPRKPREMQEGLKESYHRGAGKPSRGGGSGSVRGRGARRKEGGGHSSTDGDSGSEGGSGEDGRKKRGHSHLEQDKKPRHSLEGSLPEDTQRPPDEGRRPPNEGRRPPDEGRRPLDEGRRPPDEGRRPPDEGRRPPDEGRRPPDEGRRPPDEGRRPLDESRRPPDESRRPPDEGRRPPDEGRRPPDEGRRPPDEGRRPPDEGRRPPDDSRRPPDEGRRPPNEGRRPPDEGRRPPDEGRRLPDESRRPPSEGRRPPDEGRRLPDESRRPLNEGRRPPDETRRPPDEGRRPPEEGRRLPEDLRRPPDEGRRRSKQLERKERGHLVERTLSGSLVGNGEPKSTKLKSEVVKEDGSKRRREEEHLEGRYGERKRKREPTAEDSPLPETKKARTGEYFGPREGERYSGRGKEVELSERKRRHEGRDPSSRKQPRMHSPEGGRRHSSKDMPPGVREGRRREREKKVEVGDEVYDSVSENGSVGEDGNLTKKLDWTSLSALIPAKPAPVATSALERFAPGAIFAKIGVSPSLAGPKLFRKISSLVSEHLRKEQLSSSETTNVLPDSVLENPFGEAVVASAAASWLREQQEWTNITSDIGPCRRALTASADYAMRRKLRKSDRDLLSTSQPPPTNWDSEHYSTAVALYHSLGKKASGKPAARVEPSHIVCKVEEWSGDSRQPSVTTTNAIIEKSKEFMAMMSKKSKKPPARELGVTNATRGVWLVKVPNYLSHAWQEVGDNTDLGLMRISSNPKKVEVTFTLSESLAKEEGERVGLEIPRQHRLLTQDISSQSLATFSEDSSTGELMSEGKVIQKADIQPVDSAIYMKLKQHQIKAAEKTKFQAQQLEKTPTNVYKPRAQQTEYTEQKRKEKKDGKRARDDREIVLDLIFTAFQQHQYYNFRDLVHKTKQPVAYLKEILREVCIYNTKAPHKNMWELKPEYRHFSKDSEAKADGGGSS